MDPQYYMDDAIKTHITYIFFTQNTDESYGSFEHVSPLHVLVSVTSTAGP